MADAQLRILITAATQDIKKSLDDLKGNFQELGKSLQSINATQTNTMAAGFDRMVTASNNATKAVHQHIEEHASLRESVSHTVEVFNKLFEAARFVAGGFLGIEAVAIGKEFLDVAARTETLGIALRVVGTNAGYSVEQLEDADRAIQKLGITAQDARQSLATLIQAGISLDLGKPLARAAQDLAVITGLNSSQTFARLVQNIEQLDTVGLRFMGIMVDQQAVMERAALATGKAIGETAQRQILANAVLSEASKLAGSYEAAMASAGKQLTSFPRYIEEFKDAIGALGQQAFLQLILGARDILEALTELAKAFTDTQVNAELFGEGAEGLNAKLSPLAQVIKNVTDAIVGFIHFLEHNKGVITTFGEVVKDVAEVLTAFFVVNLGKSIYAAIGAAIARMGAFAVAVAAGGVAAEGAAVGFTALWTAALGPVGLVVGAVVALELLWNWLGKTKDAGQQQVQSYATQADAVNAYVAVMQKRIDKEVELSQLQKEIEKASFKQATASTPEQRASATAEVTALQKRRELLDKENRGLVEETQRIVKAIDDFGAVTDEHEKHAIEGINEVFSRVKASAQEAQRTMKDLSLALQQAGSDFTSYAQSTSLPVLKTLGAIDTMLQDISQEGVSAASAASTIEKAFGDLASKIKTPQELDRFVAKLKEAKETLLAKGIDETSPFANIEKQARQSVAVAIADLAAGGAQVRQQLIQAQRQKFQDEQVHLRALLALHQQQNQRLQLEDKALYDLGLQSLDEYYAKRRTETEKNNKEELEAAQKELNASFFSKRVAVTPVEIERAQRQIEQATARTQQIIETQKTKILQDEIQQAQARIKLYQQVYQTQAQLNEETGNTEIGLTQLAAAALEKELAAIKPLNDANAEDVVIRKAQVDLVSKVIDAKSKLVAQNYEERKSELDLQKAILDTQVKEGKVTDLDRQVAENDLVSKRIELLTQERAEQQALLDDMVKTGTYSVSEYNTIAKTINGLTKEIVSARGEVQHLGADLQKTFVDSFSNNLTSILNGSKSLKDGIKGFFNDINNQILGTITKNFAESIAKSLSESFGGKSGNFFDEVISAITGKKQEVLGSESKPMIVQLKDKTGEASTVIGAINAQKTIQDAIQRATERTATSTEGILKKMLADADEASKKATAGITEGSQLTGKRLDTTRPGASPFSYKGAAPEFDNQFDIAATKYGLDSYGLNGDALRFIAQKESRFNPNAVSPAGAVGVMQVMPATAEKLGYSADQMKDAATNIDAGAKLFKMELDKYQGDVDKALAAYNAGDPAVDRAIRKANAPGGSGDFKDYLPNETKDYVATLGSGGALGKQPLPVVNGADGKPLNVHQVDVAGNELSGPMTDAQMEAKLGTDKGRFTSAPDATVPETDAMGNPTGGSINLGPQAGSSGGQQFGDLLKFLGNKGLSAFMSATPLGRSISGAISTANQIQQLLKPQTPSQRYGGPTPEDINGVPRQGPYQPFEGDFPAQTEQVQQQVDSAASTTISDLGNTVEQSFGDISDKVAGGGLGIGNFFQGFGSTLSDFFNSLGGEGGGGGGGGLFASLFSGGDGSIFSDIGSLFAADGGYLSGPSHAAGGIPVEAEGGEFIINKRSTAQFLPLLHAINNSHGTANLRVPGSTRFAHGGLVEGMTGNQRMGMMRPQVTVVQHIQTPDVNSFRRSHDQLAVEQRRATERAYTRNT